MAAFCSSNRRTEDQKTVGKKKKKNHILVEVFDPDPLEDLGLLPPWDQDRICLAPRSSTRVPLDTHLPSFDSKWTNAVAWFERDMVVRGSYSLGLRI